MLKGKDLGERTARDSVHFQVAYTGQVRDTYACCSAPNLSVLLTSLHLSDNFKLQVSLEIQIIIHKTHMKSYKLNYLIVYTCKASSRLSD